MHVTVAICTWNRSALLDKTLQQMRALRVPPAVTWDLLIVNNNCTDQTDAVISEHLHHLPIRRLFEPKQGLSHARNRALDNAVGDWVLWTDDDVLVDPEWLAALHQTTTHFPNAAAIGGLVLPWFPVTPPRDLLEAFPIIGTGYARTDFGPEARALQPTEAVIGANMAFRASDVAGLRFDTALGRVGTFQGAGDDTAYYQAVLQRGGLAVWSPAMRVRHYVDPARLTLDYVRRFFYDSTLAHVRKTGIPGGARVFGVPRWVVRKYLEALAISWYFKLTYRRLKHLRWAKEQWIYSATLRACRSLAAERVGLLDHGRGL